MTWNLADTNNLLIDKAFEYLRPWSFLDFGQRSLSFIFFQKPLGQYKPTYTATSHLEVASDQDGRRARIW